MFFIKILSKTPLRPYLRNFQTLSSLFAQKKFQSHQNDYGHRVLASAAVPNVAQPEDLSKFLTKPVLQENSLESILTSKDWSSCSIDQLFTGLEEICTYSRHFNLSISDPKLNDFITAFANRRFELSDAQLMDSLKLLLTIPENNRQKSSNYVKMWQAIDEACNKRAHNWDLGTKFLFLDHFYQLGLGRVVKLTQKVIMDEGKNVLDLKKDQFLQFLFFLNVTRKPINEMIDIEANWLQLIDEMTIQEVGVVCMGLFKTQTRIRDIKVLQKLYEKLHENLDIVDSMTLTNILKILDFSTKAKQGDLITALLDALLPHIPRFELIACLHICLLGTEMNQLHEPSLSLIIDRYLAEFKNSRFKECERICFIIGLYSYKTPKSLELVQKIIADLGNRQEETSLYPKEFARFVHYLGLIDPKFVTEEMLKKCLDAEFLEKFYSSKLGTEIIFLDSFVEIFFKDSYDGPRLSQEKKNEYIKIFIDPVPNFSNNPDLTYSNRILLAIFKACHKGFSEFSRIFHVLPHFQRPDIIFAIDHVTKRAVDLTKNFPKNSSSAILSTKELLKGQNPETKIFAIISATKNQCIRPTNTPTGLVQHKILQLQRMGFETIVIEWQNWPKDRGSQIRYIQQKMH